MTLARGILVDAFADPKITKSKAEQIAAMHNASFLTRTPKLLSSLADGGHAQHIIQTHLLSLHEGSRCRLGIVIHTVSTAQLIIKLPGSDQDRSCSEALQLGKRRFSVVVTTLDTATALRRVVSD
jgi:hypothetical protein